jgi:hypothetical protein
MSQSAREVAARETWARLLAGHPEFASGSELLEQFYSGQVTRFRGLGGDRCEFLPDAEQDEVLTPASTQPAHCRLCKQAWGGVRTMFVILVKARRANGPVALVATDEDLLPLTYALSA